MSLKQRLLDAIDALSGRTRTSDLFHVLLGDFQELTRQYIVALANRPPDLQRVAARRYVRRAHAFHGALSQYFAHLAAADEEALEQIPKGRPGARVEQGEPGGSDLH